MGFTSHFDSFFFRFQADFSVFFDFTIIAPNQFTKKKKKKKLCQISSNRDFFFFFFLPNRLKPQRKKNCAKSPQTAKKIPRRLKPQRKKTVQNCLKTAKNINAKSVPKKAILHRDLNLGSLISPLNRHFTKNQPECKLCVPGGTVARFWVFLDTIERAYLVFGPFLHVRLLFGTTFLSPFDHL